MIALDDEARELFTSHGPEETRALGRRLIDRLPEDGVLLLHGDLGSGKTVLTQGLAEGLGLDPRRVQSPSYTLVNEHHAAGRTLIHIDLYRLESEDLVALGLEELLSGPGLKVVEWAERIDFPLDGAWRLRLRVEGEGGHRELELHPGTRSEREGSANNSRGEAE